MSNQILKDASLSGVSDSSSSSGSRGRRIDETHPTAMVTATRVIDLNSEFDEPATRVVDNVIERANVGEASGHKASTICFYELPFKQGLMFPVPYLIRRFLALLDMAPGQLMPNSWRLILSIEVLHFGELSSFILCEEP
ncbi:hypothetical protein ACOSQ2_012806 [Xanthoceras sorbifolium]